MSLLDSEILEKVKPTLTSLVDKIFGPTRVTRPLEQEESDFFSDKFVKNSVKDLVSAPVTKQVWVKGKPFAIIGFSQHELDSKLEKLNKNKLPEDKYATIDNILLQGRYTEEQEVETNEWAEKEMSGLTNTALFKLKMV